MCVCGGGELILSFSPLCSGGDEEPLSLNAESPDRLTNILSKYLSSRNSP